MPNTRKGREPLFPYDHELERTLRNINRNLGINDEDPNQNIPAPADVHGQMLPESPGEHQPELGCSGSDPHHLFPSFDSYCIVYALACDRRETRVFFLSVYLTYKEDSSEKKSKTIKQSKIKKILTKL